MVKIEDGAPEPNPVDDNAKTMHEFYDEYRAWVAKGNSPRYIDLSQSESAQEWAVQMFRQNRELRLGTAAAWFLGAMTAAVNAHTRRSAEERSKMQPEPEPSAPSAEAILDALKSRNSVVDAVGREVSLLSCDITGFVHSVTFPLTVNGTEPKPRRRVTRDEAIIRMAQTNCHCWDEMGEEYCVMNKELAGWDSMLCKFIQTALPTTGDFYLDPPEVKP